MSLPTSDIPFTFVIVLKITCGISIILNILFSYLIIKDAEHKYGSEWYKQKRRKPEVFTIVAYISGALVELLYILFVTNWMIDYSNDNFQNDCKNGINCTTCKTFSIFAGFLYAILILFVYIVFLELLRNTLIAANIGYSECLITAIKSFLWMPLINGIYKILEPSQIYNLNNSNLLICSRTDLAEVSNEFATQRLILVRLLSVYTSVMAPVMIGLFLYKLNQVKFINK